MKGKTTAARLFDESAAKYGPPPVPSEAAALVAEVIKGNETRGPKQRVTRGRVLEVLRDEYGVHMGANMFEGWVRRHFGRKSWASK